MVIREFITVLLLQSVFFFLGGEGEPMKKIKKKIKIIAFEYIVSYR